jgi:hypothetical protein
MRQEVKKAKLYTISKLIRELRRLKSRNGPEERKEKYNRKAERFMEEVLIIKVGASIHYSYSLPLFSLPSLLSYFPEKEVNVLNDIVPKLRDVHYYFLAWKNVNALFDMRYL